MDISSTTEPRSDQQNYDDVAVTPRTVTITEVRKGSAEQPIEIHIAEFPDRPYKPSKSMRRVLVHAWGPEASAYVGRRMTLVGDPTVKFAGAAVGGIKIAALSDIDGTLTIPLTVTRGKRQPHIVEPLSPAANSAPPGGPQAKVAPDAPAPDGAPGVSVTPDDVAACESIPQLRKWWKDIEHEEARAAITARIKVLEAEALGGGE